MRRLRLAGGIAVVALVVGSTPAGAQPPTPGTESERVLPLDVRMPRLWFAPGTPLALDVVVRNPTDSGVGELRASVALYGRVRSRSVLAQVFDGRLPRSPLEAFTVRLGDIAPGDTQVVHVSRPIEELEGFEAAPDGLYPLAVTLRRSTGPPLAEAVTAVALLAEVPEIPLDVVPVATLIPRPLLTPRGHLEAPAQRALRDMTGAVEALEAVGYPGFSMAVPPATLDELAYVASSGEPFDPEDVRLAGELLGRLADLGDRASGLTMPYAHVILPHLQSIGGSVQAQIRGGAAAYERHTGHAPAPLVFPPGDVVDDETLSALGSVSVLVPTSRLLPAEITPATVVGAGGAKLVPYDERTSRLTAGASTGLAVSRALGELAMIYFESPGRRRVVAVKVAVTAPAGGRVLERIGDAPWLRVAPAHEVAAAEASRGTLTSTTPSRTPSAYRRALRRARSAIREFQSFTLPGNAVADRLSLTWETAASTARWKDDWSHGRAWASAIVAAVRAELGRVEATASPVTFTSRRGEVPVTIVNHSGYPVRLLVSVSSPKLDFPAGDSRLLERVEPPGITLTFPAVAASSGAFPVDVSVTSPDGNVTVAAETFTVRSTGLNLLALGLTAAAALFLVFWYVRRVFRRAKPSVA